MMGQDCINVQNQLFIKDSQLCKASRRKTKAVM